MSALTNYFTSLANKMRSKTGKSTTMTPNEMITEVDAVYQAGVESVPAPVTQTKTVTAGTSATIVNPDSGKLLSAVTVNPTPSQAKTAPAIPNGISYANGATINPDSGKLLSKVTIPKPFEGNAPSKIIKGAVAATSQYINNSSSINFFPTTGIYVFSTYDSVHGDIFYSTGHSNIEVLSKEKIGCYRNGGSNTTFTAFYIVKVTSSTWSIKVGTGWTSFTAISLKLAEL